MPPYKDAMNANVRLGMQWMQMSPWEYAMMRMSAWEHAMNVRVGACHDANAPRKDAMNANARLGMQWMQMSPWEYVMMRMQFIQKFFLFSKWGSHNAWNQNILKT